MIDPDDPERRVRRSYWDPASVDGIVPRTISSLFTALGRANFRVDTVLEPQPASGGPAAPHGTTTCATSPAPSSSAPASKASEIYDRRAAHHSSRRR